MGAGHPSAAGPNACGLLTRAEIVTAIGEPVATVQGGKSSTGAVYCNWTGKDSHLLTKGIALTAARDNVAVRYKQYVALLKKKTSLAGVGVAAVTDGQVIVARSGGAMVEIAPLYANSGVTLTAVKALAKKALARA